MVDHIDRITLQETNTHLIILYHLVMTQHSHGKLPIEIDGLPIKNGWIFRWLVITWPLTWQSEDVVALMDVKQNPKGHRCFRNELSICHAVSKNFDAIYE